MLKYIPLNLNQLALFGDDIVNNLFKVRKLVDKFGLEGTLRRRLYVGSRAGVFTSEPVQWLVKKSS